MDFSHPEMIAKKTHDSRVAVHAEDIVDRLGAVDAIVELAYVAYSVRHSGDTYHYFCDVAKDVARITGWDEEPASDYFNDCYNRASAENGYRR